MANSDFRISTGYFRHFKINQLQSTYGCDGVVAHLQLLAFTAENRPTGQLKDMSREAIVTASGFQGDKNQFFDAMIALKLIDRTRNGGFAIHNWRKHNPWCFYEVERRKKAQKAAKVRWGKGRKKLDVCSNNGVAMLQHESSNAPSPIPIPSPNKQPGSPKGSPDVQYWMSKYKDRYGRDYVFSVKDGVSIAAIVKAVGPERYRQAVDWILTTDDHWYSGHCNPAILRSSINDILLRIDQPGPVDMRPKDIPR